MTGRARRLRRDMTAAERWLWDRLRQYQLGWRFRRQHPIPPYMVDFACVEAKLIVEADDGQHAEHGEHALRDRTLHRMGWRVLRFWNNDVLDNHEAVLGTIANALNSTQRESPHPDPPPPAGEGIGNGELGAP
jgi:very-short-patch-repair endonuclease